MKNLCRALLLAACAVGFASRVEAVPLLQLDIVGGHYDAASQTIVSNGPSFSLVAILTPGNNTSLTDLISLLSDTYYVSAAVTPQLQTQASIGSFTWNGSTTDVTQDMVYGVPPIESWSGASSDAGDLAGHGTFPTYFTEFAFNFSPLLRTVTYDSALNPGGLTPTNSSTNTSYYQTFNVTTNLTGPYAIHFDLYDTALKGCFLIICTDEDIDHFAPFSHDAQSGPASSSAVPEPASLLLAGSGMALSTVLFRRRKLAGAAQQ